MENLENKRKVEEYRKVKKEAEKINKKLEEELRKLIRSGENLSNYELWINKKCGIMIKTSYIIETYLKDFEKEKISVPPYKNEGLAYILVKKEEVENERV